MADPLLYSKPLQIEGFKSDNEDWLVEGYVSTFGNVDRGDDIVMAGAFDETLKSGPKVKFLLSHDPTKVLGTPTKLKEDKKACSAASESAKPPWALTLTSCCWMAHWTAFRLATGPLVS